MKLLFGLFTCCLFSLNLLGICAFVCTFCKYIGYILLFYVFNDNQISLNNITSSLSPENKLDRFYASLCPVTSLCYIILYFFILINAWSASFKAWILLFQLYSKQELYDAHTHTHAISCTLCRWKSKYCKHTPKKGRGIQSTVEHTFIYRQSFHIITIMQTHIYTHGKWFESVLCSKGRRLQQSN